MIVCLYNVANNALLGLYDVEPVPAAGQAVQALNRKQLPPGGYLA